MEPALLARLLNLPQGEEALRAQLGRKGHPKLGEALRAYLKRLQAPEEAFSALERLEAGAVVTGQQAGLLGGPALTFYKAHTALCLAHRAGAAGVFWVASQDHDVEEVRHLHLLQDEELKTLSLPLPPKPSGRLPLAPHRKALQDFLGPWAQDPRVAYALEAETLSEFFARVLLAFLGERGLLPFDPMAEELAPLFREALERELSDPLASAEAINQGARRLKDLGAKPPLGRPPGATNLFLETEERRLLFYREGAFTDGVRRYTAKELREILQADPSRLTPAAGLRPVFQDLVLPTAGFVVGPNEFRYVAELSGVYALHGLPMPALFLRMQGVVLEPPVRRILERYRLDPWAFVDRGEEAFLEALRENLEGFRQLEGELAGLLEEVQALAERARALEPTLDRPFRRFLARLGGEGERLLRKVLRARLSRDAVFLHHLERLKRHLLPLGLPQERVFPYAMYALRHQNAMERLKEAPWEGRAVLVL
ncbi:bacillithiol biosynthesis cysteine-adding enzyme BshC [Thermus arciformis]|uniref:Bacillithiol biosynthesis cysteine-adding enzyme BshC n=1 Tax=Thermus arciformis TaxID=482827 RepID=A0A1G7CKY6_9DEIN|nr:bacillithiol biosynthesis cysteine-adding enzyme BshC [Thermus arciformis]SDE39410.1 bacillithiol biosynthesis cysteine-adding enzyme BshC [Thermus arciformis]